MSDVRLFDVDGPARDRVRDEFDAIAPILTDIYAALTWPQKAVLLSSIIEAGDHPPGFDLHHDGQPRRARS